MQRVSTNLTLFYKLFIPCFWVAFFGAATLTTLTMSDNATLRSGMLAGYAGSIVVLYFTVFQLKRVEMNHESVYVTNYFRHFRYPLQDVEKIVHRNFLLFRTATIHLRAPGSFGKTMTFIPSSRLYEDFWKSHPEWKATLIPS
ncbi:MAG TPA: hypothetical protein PKC76_04910 [Saprospiraceae bacterium]|nr:hypothetical protein [Saprospiraceae bacterium]